MLVHLGGDVDAGTRKPVGEAVQTRKDLFPSGEATAGFEQLAVVRQRRVQQAPPFVDVGHGPSVAVALDHVHLRLPSHSGEGRIGIAGAVGWNATGGLGSGTMNTSASGVAVTGLTNVASLAAAYHHMVAVSNGRVYPWAGTPPASLVSGR